MVEVNKSHLPHLFLEAFSKPAVCSFETIYLLLYNNTNSNSSSVKTTGGQHLCLTLSRQQDNKLPAVAKTEAPRT